MVKDNKNKLADKTELEKALLAGIHGPPELKRREKQRLLGQFRERVLKVLTFDQVAEPGTYPEINAAIQNPAAKKLIVSSRADISSAAEYIRLARTRGLTFTTVDQPDFHGNVALVVAADQAVDQSEIFIPTRTERLSRLGVPLPVIKAVGKPLCSSCRQLLREKAPEELANYPRLSLYHKLLGYNCPCGNNEEQ